MKGGSSLATLLVPTVGFALKKEDSGPLEGHVGPLVLRERLLERKDRGAIIAAGRGERSPTAGRCSKGPRTVELSALTCQKIDQRTRTFELPEGYECLDLIGQEYAAHGVSKSHVDHKRRE